MDTWARYGARIRPAILLRDGFMCQIAGPDCEGPGQELPAERLEVDHIEPRAQGGDKLSPLNLQTVCKPCHKRKTLMQQGYQLQGVKLRGKPRRPPSNTPLELTK